MGSTDVVSLKINGVDYEVNSESIDERLVNFLQDNGSSGTHVTCYEGGCGACTVVASVPVTGSITGERKTISLNSCLASLYGCDNWEVTTIEGLGNRFDGYNVLQERLADYNGSQCGYCSPGMVMNMHGLTQSGATWTASDVEHHLDGNICRCTGYRPILEAFKSITPVDIEDVGKAGKCCKNQKRRCQAKKIEPRQSKKEIVVDGVTWYQPTSLQEMNDIINAFTLGTNYRFVCGNTSVAFYDNGPYSAFINTRMVPELYVKTITAQSATFGANTSITEMIDQFKSLAVDQNLSYLTEIANHWSKVANASVRNLGSVGGNLMLKTQMPSFPSDIFSTLLAAGAMVNISSDGGATVAYYDLETMLSMDFLQSKSVLLDIQLYPLPDNTIYRSFKVMPRNANSRAYVAASFCIQFDTTNGHTVIGTPVLAFNGISSTFLRASNTEAYLVGKNLENPAVLQGALTTLASEIVPDTPPEDPSAEYKIAVSQNLFYRYVLGLVSSLVSPDYISGSAELLRPTSSGKQTYELNEETWPLGKPIPKLEAKIQCAGEAEYVRTMKPVDGELVGMFVRSTRANALITNIDATNALSIPGVVGFVSAADIPGLNNVVVYADPNYPEKLFPGISDRVGYYGQPVGLIIASNRGAAYSGIYSVTVSYEDEQPPILTIADALAQGSTDTLPGMEYVVGDVALGFSQSTQIITGSMLRDGQYHFHMETHSCLTIPTEDGFDVFSSTQWLSETQASIAQVLGVTSNSINLSVRRCGGGFGAKIDRCNIVASASALGAYKVRKPVKIDLDLDANMTMIGWRDPFMCDYKIGVDANGLLMAVEATITSDSGYIAMDSSCYAAVVCLPSCYACPNWNVMPQVAITNTASNTWCRSPSTVEGITFMENIMDNVAAVLGMDPLDFRRLNLIQSGAVRRATVVDPKKRALLRSAGPHRSRNFKGVDVTIDRSDVGNMIDQIIVSSNYNIRKDEVAAFNSINRWHKRGIVIMPMLWPYFVPPVYGFNVLLAIYPRDGTVVIAHGGVELGQGINTKVAQTAAYILGCKLELVKVKPTNTLSGANSNCTGGSLGSDINIYCIKAAAEKLRQRLDTIIKPTWEEKVAEAFATGMDLTERYWNGAAEIKSYPVYGVACTEVELDVLTGNFQVSRVDVLEDAGKSPNPLVDVGQVEGAFVMGQGLFTTEKPIYDSSTGRKVSDSTWIYKVPSALDIPIDLRVTLLQNAPNDLGVLSSKVTGEPPLALSFSIVMALRQAIACARADAGNIDWFDMNTPMTIDKIQELCLVTQPMLTFGQ